ncbi:MAG TPA: HEAT repeat domain-containing protein [Planctomycetota bacterium]|nr:HEAT repeat domain-containing protein [Planctomycetota bacterium]
MTWTPRVVGMAVASLVVGFLVGLFLGLRGQGERARPIGKDVSRERLLRTAHVPVSGEQLTLQEISLLQQGEIGRLEAELARLGAVSGKGMTRQQKLAFAKRVCETYAAEYEGDMHPARKHELMQMLYQLDEEMTPYFVERYETDPDPTLRGVAWYLAVASGGPVAAEFLGRWIDDPATPPQRRAELLDSLCGFDPIVPITFQKIPVGDTLGATALRLSDSASAGDRRGAAALLGNYGAPESEAVLRRLADSDADPETRGVAIRSLGRIGTPQTLAYLRSYPGPSADVGYPDPAWYVKASLADSLRQLKLKFPE